MSNGYSIRLVRSLAERYDVERAIGVQTIYAGGATAVAMAVERLVVHPTIVRTLGYDAFGELILGIYWTMLIVAPVSTGVCTALMRRLPGLEDGAQARTLRHALVLCVSACAPLLVVAAAVMLWGTRTRVMPLSGVFLVFFAYGPMVASVSILNTWFRVKLKLAPFYILQALPATFTVVTLVLLPLFAIWALPIAYVAAAGLALACSVIALPRQVLLPKQPGAAEPIAHDAAQIAGYCVMSSLLVTVDKSLAGWFGGASGVGLYVAVSTVCQLFLFPVEMFSGVLLPYVVEPRTAQRVMSWPRFALLCVAVPMTIAVAALSTGSYLAQLLYGLSLTGSTRVLFLCAVVTTAAASVAALARGIVAMRCRPMTMALINGGALLALGIVGGILGPTWGVAGVAAATAVAATGRAGALILAGGRVLAEDEENLKCAS